jgi:hypothetical protein
MKATMPTYSKSNAPRLIAALIGLVFLSSVSTLYSPDGHSVVPRPFPLKFALQMEIIVWIAALLTVLFVMALGWQLFADNGRAIWIENGNIIHLHEWYQSADRNDIEAILSGTFGIFDRVVVIIQMRGGKTLEIPAYLLSESADAIAARLK